MGWDPDSFVFDDPRLVAYASRVQDGTLEIAGIERTGGEWVATMGGNWDDLGGTNTVALGEGTRAGTFIYGSAEAGVAKVVTDAPDAVGGLVTDGGWIFIWSPDASLMETDTLAWRFLAEDGSIVEEGTGWQWPFGSPFEPPPIEP